MQHEREPCSVLELVLGDALCPGGVFAEGAINALFSNRAQSVPIAKSVGRDSTSKAPLA